MNRKTCKYVFVLPYTRQKKKNRKDQMMTFALYVVCLVCVLT